MQLSYRMAVFLGAEGFTVPQRRPLLQALHYCFYQIIERASYCTK